MRKFGVISDPHYHDFSAFSGITDKGVNTRLQVVIDSTLKAVEQMRSEGIETLYFAGDIFHVRGSLKPSVLNPVMNMFREIGEHMNVRMIPGNHDLEGKYSEDLSSAITALQDVGVEVLNHPVVFEFDRVAVFPWYHSQKDLLRDMESQLTNLHEPETWTAIIHAPVNGVIKGIPDTGICPSELSALGYGLVLAGHYHNHKQLAENVYSIGALTHQTWGDVATTAGFLVVSDLKVEQHMTSAPRFMDFESHWNENEAKDNCAGNYIRVRLDSATESEVGRIREFLTRDCGALGCIIQATPQNRATARSTSVVAATGSTLSSIKEWIDSNADDVDKAKLLATCEDILREIEEVA